jgi:2-keto-4-pentenoate hydratase/2-oxohepta-3-ene-1,7-dioic acid hydratase in catechol pathway
MSNAPRLDPPTPCPSHRFVRFTHGASTTARVGVLLAEVDRAQASTDRERHQTVYAATFREKHRDGARARVSRTMRELLTMYAARDAFEMTLDADDGWTLGNVTLLACADDDAKLCCVGKNYVEHVGEVDTQMPGISKTAIPELPIIFPKATTSLCGSGTSVELRGREDVDYEGELTAIIKRECKDIPDDASDADIVRAYVGGWTIANDVTARVLQKSHQQWYLGKSCDGFCPLGPWIVAGHDALPSAASLVTRVNGEIRQNSTVDKMIFSTAALIRCVSKYQTLRAGDAILTGTPSGVGAGFDPKRFLRPGDVVEIEIEGIGALVNDFIA